MSAKPLGDSGDVLADVADELFWWLVHTHVQPEANRRVDTGAMQRGESIYRAQVLFTSTAKPSFGSTTRSAASCRRARHDPSRRARP
jgi:hypothetical protein